MYLQIALKLVIGMIGLLTVVRLLGKKSLSEATPFDLIYTLVLGGLLEESIYDDKVNPLHLLLAIALWGVTVYFIETIVQKNIKTNKVVKGEPSILIFDGELNLEEIKKNHISMDQLRALLRQQNCYSVQNAQFVIMEVGGQITVVKNGQEDGLSFQLIESGRIEEPVLQTIGKDRQWLLNELKKEGKTLREIVYAEWSFSSGLFIKTYEQSKQEIYRLDN
ncbi:DUF421 domain-containing protein [Pisciglobus halotolerans]|uniref:Uncharacterized membrane protein YcaP, DUF421 family n=1 Tax=Pisciglobus halotolerans TaxID=745365 RepID=A0A1I3DXZ9_9LACT|nr:DUF421 domain-containing protein [Pisciglobus halotolerans]SFH91624.1 Uncharacterized membrane protein YcaP, DUF421 family [Pisciglobus halotolerans]